MGHHALSWPARLALTGLACLSLATAPGTASALPSSTNTGATTTTTAADDALVVVDSLPGVPTGWRRAADQQSSSSSFSSSSSSSVDAASSPSTRILHLRVALAQPEARLAAFRSRLLDVSTPQHPLYGRHLSRREVRDMLRPTDGARAAVLRWLRAAGPGVVVEGQTVGGDDDDDDADADEWVSFTATVEAAEKLLGAEFAVYRHVEAGVDRIRTLSYSVPRDVREHITMIQPTTRFGQMRPQRSTVFEVVRGPQGQGPLPGKAKLQTAGGDGDGGLDPSCNSTVTPACLRALYEVGDAYADPDVPTVLGVGGFLEQWAKHDALEQFLKDYAPYAATQNFSTVLVNGGADDQGDQQEDDVEANLDIQYVAAMGFNSTIRYYSTGGRGKLVPDLDQPDPNDNSNEPYLEYLTYLLDLPDEELPLTLTTSYGEDEQSVPIEYVKKVCDMFGQLGARGTSVIFSSGDTGPGSACQTNDGKNTTRLLPTFPGACPYVTSVGGTVGVSPERAVSFSSGGFSDVFDRPAYQDAAVSTYLTSRLAEGRFEGLFNPDGRGFPDVAAQGKGFAVVDRGEVISVGGTSASAPTFAGLVALLNNARRKAGKPALGFLNPWLYGEAAAGADKGEGSALTDIVDGGSVGCTGKDIYSGLPTPYVPGAGWNATEGWDPVTGLGTPRFGRLLELALK